MALARRNLGFRRQVHSDGSADVWFDARERLLGEGVDAVVEMITADTDTAESLQLVGPHQRVSGSNKSCSMACDRGGNGSVGKKRSHNTSAASRVVMPMMPARVRKSSSSRLRAANAFMAKTCSADAAMTRIPG